MTVDEKENCILYALCNAAPPFFTVCVTPEPFENQQNNSNDGGGGRGWRERQMSEGSFINHLVTEVETAC
jgi:hypothetical protein